MRNFVIIGLVLLTVSLTSCAVPVNSYRSQDYLTFADGTHSMVAAVRDNIRFLRKLDDEARQTSLALAFVRSEEKNNLKLPPPNFSEETTTAMMVFLQALENYSESLVFGVASVEPISIAEQAQELSRLTQLLHAQRSVPKIAAELQESHAVLQNAVAVLAGHWRGNAMRDLPRDIVATLNANEERLLLINKSLANEAERIYLYMPVLQHLQKRDLRSQFLQNWQEVAELCDKMLVAHITLAEGEQVNEISSTAMREFLRAAISLQDRSENLVFAYDR